MTNVLDQNTPWGPAGDVFTVYRGPCQDRLTLRRAAADGVLVFSVNRSHIGIRLGERECVGYYDTFEDALLALRDAGDGWRLSAHHRGWGGFEECILFCSWWKPLGDLLN